MATRQQLMAEVEVEEAQPAFDTQSGSGTILLVEDDCLLLWITSEILQEMGYIVAQRGILEEGVCFIQKPINPGELNDKIKRLLAEH